MIQLQLLEATPAWPRFPASPWEKLATIRSPFHFVSRRGRCFRIHKALRFQGWAGAGFLIIQGVRKAMLLWSFSCVQLFAIPRTAACQTSLCLTISQSSPKFMSIELAMLYNHLILCCPFLLLPSIFPSIRVFSNESALCIRWPKYWSFSFSISPSNEYSGLISFTIDWFDLLVVQGPLKSLLWHHNSKVSILQSLAFFMVHLKKVLIAWITTMVWSLT